MEQESKIVKDRSRQIIFILESLIEILKRKNNKDVFNGILTIMEWQIQNSKIIDSKKGERR